VRDDPADYVAASGPAVSSALERVLGPGVPLRARSARRPVRPVTNKAACQEDLEHAARGEVVSTWAKITMPALLLRATVAFGGASWCLRPTRGLPGRGPGLRVVEVERNHFGIVTDDGAVAAVAELLGG